MHCLGELRKHYWILLDGMTNNDTVIIGKAQKLLGPAGVHVHHCFDYLRQTIMCAGDMSMEWPRTEADGRRVAVDGWGIPHTCKSWVSGVRKEDGLVALANHGSRMAFMII